MQCVQNFWRNNQIGFSPANEFAKGYSEIRKPVAGEKPLARICVAFNVSCFDRHYTAFLDRPDVAPLRRHKWATVKNVHGAVKLETFH